MDIDADLLRYVEVDREHYLSIGREMKAKTSNELRYHQVKYPIKMRHDIPNVEAYVSFHFAEERLFEISYLVYQNGRCSTPKLISVPDAQVRGPSEN